VRDDNPPRRLTFYKITDMEKLRIIHNPARCGGTIMSKAMAVHDGVELYSEIHAQGPTCAQRYAKGANFLLFNIKVQAFTWFQHYDDSFQDRAWTADNINNTPADIEECLRLTAERGHVPVLREWSHLDFFGAPFCDAGGHSLLHDAFKDRFDVTAIALTRHPLSMWLSFQMTAVLKDAYGNIDGYRRYLACYQRYADFVASIPRFKYEGFMADQPATVSAMAKALCLEPDPNYAAKMADYEKLTGDSSAMGRKERNTQSRPLNRVFYQQLTAEPAYQHLCDSLGYQADEVPYGYHLVGG